MREEGRAQIAKLGFCAGKMISLCGSCADQWQKYENLRKFVRLWVQRVHEE